MNVLTISVATGADNDLLSTDALLTDLISLTDQGNQLMLEEIDEIVSMSQERLYKWLHSLAGLELDFAQSTSNPATELQQQQYKKPSFRFDVGQVGHIVSTKSIVQRLW